MPFWALQITWQKIGTAKKNKEKMTNSKVQIYNITLNILGVSTPLENAQCQDNKAILLNNYYELARDYVLKDFDWNFACAYRVLTKSTKQITSNEYLYSWDYPNDCICARDVFESGNKKLNTFSISTLDDGQKIILTNVTNPILRYTRRIEQEIYYTCEFTMALAYYLASLTSNVITGSMQKGENAYQKYRQILKRAKVLNAQEGADIIYDESTYLDARG